MSELLGLSKLQAQLGEPRSIMDELAASCEREAWQTANAEVPRELLTVGSRPPIEVGRKSFKASLRSRQADPAPPAAAKRCCTSKACPVL